MTMEPDVPFRDGYVVRVETSKGARVGSSIYSVWRLESGVFLP